jgi:predicted ester cyclase
MAPMPGSGSPAEELEARYRAYLACLNERAWHDLARHVDAGVVYNRDRVGLTGYLEMLELDAHQVPDLHYEPGLLVVQPPFVAARLDFDCSPRGRFLGVDVNGRRIAFAENVFYRYAGSRIVEVWSVIDKAAVERQLAG